MVDLILSMVMAVPPRKLILQVFMFYFSSSFIIIIQIQMFIAMGVVLCRGWHREGSFCGVRLHFEATGEGMLLGLCVKLGTLY